jgi:hypothetical protein
MCLIECDNGDMIFFLDISRISIRTYKGEYYYFIFTANNNPHRLQSKPFKTRELALDWLQEVYDHQKDSYIYTLH